MIQKPFHPINSQGEEQDNTQDTSKTKTKVAGKQTKKKLHTTYTVALDQYTKK